MTIFRVVSNPLPFTYFKNPLQSCRLPRPSVPTKNTALIISNQQHSLGDLISGVDDLVQYRHRKESPNIQPQQNTSLLKGFARVPSADVDQPYAHA
jgi:hypothetical protein